MISPNISVLIASYNSRGTLIPCIGHLAKQTLPFGQFEVIVVLDGSTDGSRTELEALRTPFKLKIIEQDQQGRASALNKGASHAAGEYLAIIDSDILACPEFLRAHLQAHDKADVVIGPIPLSPVSPKSFMTENVRIWAENHARKMTSHPDEISGTDIYGANLSLTRSLFQKLGGYRADLKRTEDYHFGEKILQAGLKAYYCPTAVAEQIYDKTFPAWCRDFYIDGRSQLLLVGEFPHLKSRLKLGRYHPQSGVKHFIRPLVIHDRPMGKALIALGKLVLEWARSSGLCWKLLSSFQGLMGDCLYWKGVYDAMGSRERFEQFIQPPPNR